jgi:hypothetical protein
MSVVSVVGCVQNLSALDETWEGAQVGEWKQYNKCITRMHAAR